MRRIRYQVATSLDGYIAGPGGAFDWIVPDPDIDFEALHAEFDTYLMGRRTFEVMKDGLPAGNVLVFSRTLRQEDHPDVTIVCDDVKATLDALLARPGKDVWLFGGGELFRTLLELGYVHTVEPAIVPVLLGGGVPFLPQPAVRTRLVYTGQRHYPKSGITLLEYDVARD